ncbi:MAG: serine hydrolase [Pseudomonadota bacterium]
MTIPQNEPDRCGLAWAAKVIASGVFITGRDPQDVFAFSCNWMAAPDALMKEVLETKNPEPLLSLPISIDVDRDKEVVTLALYGRTAHAKRFGDHGCMVVDDPHDHPHYAPVALTPKRVHDGFEPEAIQTDVVDGLGLDGDAISGALDALFQNPMEMTNAIVIVHKGQIVAERYRDPFGPDTQFENWSMGKSLAATLTGIAIRKGALHLDQDDLFDEWQGTDRQAIKVRDILNMASGLRFTGSFGRTEDHSVKQQDGLFLDHIYVYASGTDARAFCLSKPLEAPPGTSGKYRNCDPLLAAALVRDRVVDGDVETFLRWPQEQLFDAIGMRGMVLETDPYGLFLISGHDYGRARDWARLGQLYLNRGAWGGQQLLDEHFTDFVRTPATRAWAHDPYYGGFFPTNATAIIPGVPSDAFWASGGGLQRTLIVPSKDLVIVRLGHMAGTLFGVEKTMNAAFAQICDAVSA